MSTPKGYNVEQVTDLSELKQEQISDLLGQLLKKLKIEVWTNTTPDYTEIILTDSDE